MTDEARDRDATPSPHRLQQAREQGQVARSRELIFAIVFAAGLAVVLAQGRAVYDWACQLLLEAMDVRRTVTASANPPQLIEQTQRVGEQLLGIVTLPLFLLVLAVVAGHWIQHGPLWLPHQLAPDFGRANPALGWHRIVRRLASGDWIVGLMRVMLLTGIGTWWLWQQRAAILALAGMPMDQLAQNGTRLMWQLGLALSAGLLLIGGLDFALQYWQFHRSLNSSPDPSRDEVRSVQNDLRSARGKRFNQPQPSDAS